MPPVAQSSLALDKLAAAILVRVTETLALQASSLRQLVGAWQRASDEAERSFLATQAREACHTGMLTVESFRATFPEDADSIQLENLANLVAALDELREVF